MSAEQERQAQLQGLIASHKQTASIAEVALSKQKQANIELKEQNTLLRNTLTVR